MTTPETRSRGRYRTSSGPVSWPTSGRSPSDPTTAPPTRPRSSWSSSTRSGAGPRTMASCASWKARRGRRWPGSSPTPTGRRGTSPTRRARRGGLVNQGWKDSKDSMLFRDGTSAAAPIAPCEVQGYVYDAYMRTAELADDVWGDLDLAGELESEAAAFRDRFDRDFWMDDRGYYALALDGEGRKVDSVTSNPGHLLWSGIVPAERARLVADHLLGEAMFSAVGDQDHGRGGGRLRPRVLPRRLRLAPRQRAHLQGLRRYGLRAEANRVASALVDASPHFDYRLPEVFAGQRRGTGVRSSTRVVQPAGVGGWDHSAPGARHARRRARSRAPEAAVRPGRARRRRGHAAPRRAGLREASRPRSVGDGRS